MSNFSLAFHCPSCDVWGAQPECWVCGRTAILVPERLKVGGAHTYRHSEKYVMMHGVTMRVDPDDDESQPELIENKAISINSHK